MNRITRSFLCGLGGLALIAGACAQEPRHGITNEGVTYLSGGTGAVQQKEIDAERLLYNTRITTENRRTGRGVAGAKLLILDAKNHAVFDQAMEGPWLLINLPAGEYRLEAEYRGQTQRDKVSIDGAGHATSVLSFDVDA